MVRLRSEDMKIVWLFFMGLVFAGISSITRNRYVVCESDVKRVCFPAVFIKILRGCFGICIVFAGIMLFWYQDNGIALIFLIMGMVGIGGAWGVGRYAIILEEEVLIVVPLIGRKYTIKIEEIQYLKKRSNESVDIVVNGKKIVTLDPMLVGLENFILQLQERGVSLHYKEN